MKTTHTTMKTTHATTAVEKKMATAMRCSQIVCLWAGCVLLACTAMGADQLKPATAPPSRDISFANEIQHAIDRGLGFLLSSQNSNGWWSTPDQPAVTALALTAFMGEPTGRYRTNMPVALVKGYGQILDSVKPDGSIYRNELANYNTSLSMMALVAAHNPAYDNILRRARSYLVKSQSDFNELGKVDSPYDGGVGYGDKYAHSDMNNTLTALEALYYTRHLVSDKTLPESQTKDLNWDAAIQFVQSCQNLPGYNTQTWVSGDSTNRGGFVYFPGDSKAGAVTNPVTGRVTLRSYGSISYAGLLSYVYADLKREDPRVAAVLDWLRTNYTLEENPGMGLQGLYYYLYLMTKALNTSGMDTLEMKDGTKINWRHEVAMRLINLQKQDGSLANTNGRWWEMDPNLVTTYTVLSLDIIHAGIR